ncbi:LysR substrate-binding domain-containing protein [Vibrio tapetis subsp. quintayensis]|uniref:LysR substrate-binding domain-containing protein n=1 Tax=Vibrio tapetis TaxID=52443 RepID=UPI0025B309CC|nr:LysR substrate-binding domain-containing protein [Vibrio tapetis]MDN3682423.1 LysR substrate-binding domain-containing protein [Vibrio tapetis subsp. quintayensis]
MIDLNDYFYFVHVVEKKGFSAAARTLGVPKSRLSRHVSQLEERLNIRLIQRTSRSISVTDAGDKFYQHARLVLDNMERAEASVQPMMNSLSGKVRISCSVGVAQFALKEIVTDFAIEQPQVQLEQHVSNDTIDLVSQGIDLVIRGHMATLPDSTLIQKKLATVEWHLFVGTPFIERHGLPDSPYALNDLPFLKVGWRNRNDILHLEHCDGIKTQIQLNTRFRSDDMETLSLAASKGLGIVALPAYACHSRVQTGSLTRILPDWIAGAAQLSLLMPSRTGVPAQVNAFSEYLRANFVKAVTP